MSPEKEIKQMEEYIKYITPFVEDEGRCDTVWEGMTYPQWKEAHERAKEEGMTFENWSQKEFGEGSENWTEGPGFNEAFKKVLSPIKAS